MPNVILILSHFFISISFSSSGLGYPEWMSCSLSLKSLLNGGQKGQQKGSFMLKYNILSLSAVQPINEMSFPPLYLYILFVFLTIPPKLSLFHITTITVELQSKVSHWEWSNPVIDHYSNESAVQQIRSVRLACNNNGTWETLLLLFCSVLFR